jgi:hypothetical protein
MSSQIDLLGNKFNILLEQYKETYQEFINVMNSDTNQNTYTNIADTSYIGESNLNVIQNSSLDNCLSSCQSNTSCSGATFDNIHNSCTLSSGMGSVIDSKNTTAIVKQALYYSYKLQKLNEELITVNSTIIGLTNSKMNDYSTIKEHSEEKSRFLNNNYEILQKERIEIGEMIRQYETLNSAYNDVTVNVTSNYYNYLLYLIFVIFLVVLLFKFNLSGQQVGGSVSNKFSKTSIAMYIFLFFVIILNAIIKN